MMPKLFSTMEVTEKTHPNYLPNQFGWYVEVGATGCETRLFQGVDREGNIKYDGAKNDNMFGPFKSEQEALDLIDCKENVDEDE